MARFILLIAIGFGLVLAPAAHARQVALVIANSQYAATKSLTNPPSDAQLVAGALEQVGFETVTIANDLGFDEFVSQLRNFRQLAEGADTAVVYFAGHGIEGKGRNWLLPVDAAPSQEEDLPFEAIELQLAMEALSGARLKIALLDACRNNPFANNWSSTTRSTTQGLAPVEVDDVLVIYAAAPGAVAYDGKDGNSPFAKALARRLIQPGLPVQMLGGMVRDDVLAETKGRQRPFISASITGQPLYLVEGPQEAGAVAAPDSAADRAAWDAALALDSIAGYRTYLRQWPTGLFTEYARANVAQLLDPTAHGGKVTGSKRGLISARSALADRYDVPRSDPLAIDGIWTITSIDKRIRIEGGRAFAVDGWNHLGVLRVEPDQVVLTDLRSGDDGAFVGFDQVLQAKMTLKIRSDGNLDYRASTFPFPTKLVFNQIGVDDPDAFATLEP
ncbi:caspase domain-containing protein [Erythrobacter sp. GH1-10]|uniref:caspase domain-containing protein n=1 Tax=Erythrobacter sp. GH1-10 TaxID=3349334 RepID=UPI003877E768